MKIYFVFSKPHGLGKGGSGIVNPVKLEQKTKKIYNLVSDFTPQQQAEAVAATSATKEEADKQAYQMNSLYDLSVTNNRTKRKQSAKQKAVADSINAQQQQQQSKGNKKSNKNKKQNTKAHQQQKRQKQKKMNDFITKELSKLNL